MLYGGLIMLYGSLIMLYGSLIMPYSQFIAIEQNQSLPQLKSTIEQNQSMVECDMMEDDAKEVDKR